MYAFPSERVQMENFRSPLQSGYHPLSARQCEVLYAIWWLDQHPEACEEVTVAEIAKQSSLAKSRIHDILSEIRGKSPYYLITNRQDSLSRQGKRGTSPATYRIDPDCNVTESDTAFILLQLLRYRKSGASSFERKEFTQYLTENFGIDKPSIERKIDWAIQHSYIGQIDSRIFSKDRIDCEKNFLLLIVKHSRITSLTSTLPGGEI